LRFYYSPLILFSLNQGNVFKKTFGIREFCGSNSYNAKVHPLLLFNPKRSIRERLMKGLFNGDGSFDEKTGTIECDTSYLSQSYVDEDIPQGLYVYIEVSDTGRGMNEETIRKQHKRIDELNEQYADRGVNFRIFKGIESDIREDGSLDYPDDAVNENDHTRFVETVERARTQGTAVIWITARRDLDLTDQSGAVHRAELNGLNLTWRPEENTILETTKEKSCE